MEKKANLYAILSYLWVLCLIPLLLKKDDKAVMFHAKQGLVLFICEAAFFIIGIVPLLGWFIAQVGIFICGVISIIAIVQVLMGNEWKIPIIADWAEKIKI